MPEGLDARGEQPGDGAVQADAQRVQARGGPQRALPKSPVAELSACFVEGEEHVRAGLGAAFDELPEAGGLDHDEAPWGSHHGAMRLDDTANA